MGEPEVKGLFSSLRSFFSAGGKTVDVVLVGVASSKEGLGKSDTLTKVLKQLKEAKGVKEQAELMKALGAQHVAPDAVRIVKVPTEIAGYDNLNDFFKALRENKLQKRVFNDHERQECKHAWKDGSSGAFYVTASWVRKNWLDLCELPSGLVSENCNLIAKIFSAACVRCSVFPKGKLAEGVQAAEDCSASSFMTYFNHGRDDVPNPCL